MELDIHPNFERFTVNRSYSVVHVPTNVYDKAPDIMNAIHWSESLTHKFSDNMANDPNLSWQYFGSRSGFIRLYPATKWPQTEGPDLYDCRIRHWYIKAAASPKDLVILLDTSGSMTGLRKDIARGVVYTILDTLEDNDFVNVLKFSETVEPVVPCFNGTLVQANKQNIREFHEHLEDLDTRDIANFSQALISAFELLKKCNLTKNGSQCNQALMLVTDGAPYTFDEIFNHYNWPNISVRVFTYLIGREVTDIREVNWMACANRGYYTHVATLAEVREQVEKYIPVMSRPIGLSNQHPVTWTPVSAPPSSPLLSNWLWEEREQAKIKKLRLRQREQRQMEVGEMDMVRDGEIIGEEIHQIPSTIEIILKPKKSKNIQLFTTVAIPAFDPRNYTVRDTKLLGVAGTDVPIKEILKLVPSYKLGVNGYAFIITNNGYVLFHPDLRPLFQDMLKPGYSSTDLLEVELVNNNLPAREPDEDLQMLRREMINRNFGSKQINVKLHQDGMRRVVTRTNTYYYGPIKGTPFSLGIVLPEPYGQYRVNGRVLMKVAKPEERNWEKYFLGNNWRIHPTW
ncbi:voltage-dependent calcium channel subunit alpha-2/delta-3-like [Limulus polyphemus]|uniref:Voltage-dependent calcium channel subunit alpha-2/delta-3-like n=1 Tax=Limulus polyphemus TaxID=6850 RepID=A0ABM1TNQ1_LIMPO|nr:voltage-dependent calcium channel subunit alpha-2/delta-3-like [Limulus polyphemus]